MTLDFSIQVYQCRTGSRIQTACTPSILLIPKYLYSIGLITGGGFKVAIHKD